MKHINTPWRKYAFVVALFVAGLIAVSFVKAATAAKPPAPPGQGECAHGNSLKPCKDDPQPEKGKDCEEHGKKGGVNEDHCKGETPPTPTTPTETTPTETTPTTPEVTTPDEPTGEDTGGEGDPGVSPDPEPAADKPVTRGTLEDELEKQAKKNNPSGVAGYSEARPDELPYTGFPTWLAVLLGLGSVGGGLYLRRRA